MVCECIFPVCVRCSRSEMCVISVHGGLMSACPMSWFPPSRRLPGPPDLMITEHVFHGSAVAPPIFSMDEWLDTSCLDPLNDFLPAFW